MTLKLDVKDKKITALLDENSRFSNSQIARKVGLSKPAVDYRLRRLEKNNVVFQYYTVIDFTKLGYAQYKIYFKFQNATLESEQKIVDYWNNDKNSVWVAQIRGRWDLSVSILARSNFEFGEILGRFMKKHAQFILEKDVLLTEYSPIYAREYLADTKPSEFIYGVPSEVCDLDEVDKKILKELAGNARMHIVSLAEKTKLSRDIVSYRLKKLTKDGIIVQHRCYLNLHHLGIHHYKIIFRTKNFSERSEEEIRSYVTQSKKATQFLKLIGSWDLEVEFETEGEDELYEILTDMRKKFSDVIRDFDILRITKTYKYTYFPF